MCSYIRALSPSRTHTKGCLSRNYLACAFLDRAMIVQSAEQNQSPSSFEAAPRLLFADASAICLLTYINSYINIFHVAAFDFGAIALIG